jgi:hypothetical protein
MTHGQPTRSGAAPIDRASQRVALGELLGVIYRSARLGAGRRPRAYIHLMRIPPRLVSNLKGTQLYIVGGRYRVTPRGIVG